ncbi:histidine kinase dimerization/phospho-acceptor domain-containing protein [Bacillus weihaiensis]|uniref:histidine kinase dimerization/phospho-acceptor domain-containing protein n=1 Tax=Bacillus weihaiensis TaxID=1547283 RepID=UPI00235665E4|nr:histidine kinase dimerization/phospho-acceptor domain-containing protein [Bacillus weihaiensis]
MDIKWKNRILILICSLLFSYGVIGMGLTLSNHKVLLKEDFFESEQFKVEELNKLISFLYSFDILNDKLEKAKDTVTATQEEINEHRYMYGELGDQLQNIEQQYESRILEAENSHNQKVADAYREERDKKMDDITKNFESDEYIKEKVIKEKLQQIEEYKREIENSRGEYEKYKEAFVYFLEDTETGEIYSNVDSQNEKAFNVYLYDQKTLFLGEYPSNQYGYLRADSEPLVYVDSNILSSTNTSLKGKIAVTETNSASSFLLNKSDEYETHKQMLWSYFISALITFLLSLFILRKFQIVKKIQLDPLHSFFRKVQVDIQFLLFGLTSLIAICMYWDMQHYFTYNSSGMGFEMFTLTSFVGLSILQAVILYPKLIDVSSNKEILRSTISAALLRMLKEMFLKRSVGVQVFVIMGVIFCFGFGFAVVVIQPQFILLYAPAFLLIAVPILILIMRRTGYFNKIIKNTNALANGYFEPDLKVAGKSVLATLAKDINTMKHGVKQSQKEQMKSERLKTELITNVSHDLRTPLTSIITYSELLKNQEISDDERNSYIEIIDRKSKRLKVLIDDLFEASKMASGNIELSKNRVDLVQLLQQALAEYNESIQESSIVFKVQSPDHPVYAVVDGQKLWRVFENLIGNILKYSLENTRAYIHLKENNGKIGITFKNISKYELNDDIEELFERFKRGDESRNTEGSGLGLAIAKSIIDLHDGILEIDVDGDLFKVTIELDRIEG